MEIIIAENSGFCFGVERSLQLALSSIQFAQEKQKNKKIPIYSLGPLIHNPQVVQDLEKKGIKVISKLSNIKKGILIIRSHGVSPEVLEEAKSRKFKVIDATCPFVKKAQKLVQQLTEQNYRVIIIGDRSHPEVLGLLGFSAGQSVVVSDVKGVDKIPCHLTRIGVVAQTTQLFDNFRNVVTKLLSKTKELKIYNTICEATAKRQESAKVLAAKVDLMLVIGGYNSANTTRLAEVCREQNSSTYHIEKLEDFDFRLLNNKEKIGITAGASTPDWVIKEIVKKLSQK